MILLPLIEGDLTRSWADLLVASDASPSYGFGVSVANAAPELLRSFARDAGKRRAFARLERNGSYEDEEPEKPRQVRPCRLPIAKAAFCTVVSARAEHAAHAGAFEADGIRLGLRWWLRSAKRHNQMVVTLVGAQAVMGAVCKGRSSSLSLRRKIMRIAALQHAGNPHLRLVYVPSQDNPADAASRGAVRRWRSRHTCLARSKRAVVVKDDKRRREYKASHKQRQAQRTLKRVMPRMETHKREWGLF